MKARRTFLTFAVILAVFAAAPSHAFNQPPLICRTAPEQAGEGGWKVEGAPSVLISGLRWSGSDVFMRVYECAGRAADARLRVPARFTLWAPADGLQRPQGKFAPLESSLALHLKPFEIRGLLLRGK